MRDRIVGALTLLLGTLFGLAAVGDFVGHLFGMESPWPWYLNVVFAALSVLLLFPDRIALAAKHARTFLPWEKS